VTLCDAGPLIALLDKRDAHHLEVRGSIDSLRLPLVTTWPAFTEAAHLLYAAGGWMLQRSLCDLVIVDQLLTIHTPTKSELATMRTLIERYRNVPMDLADASLVVAADTLELRTLFTLDSDFRIYRTPAGHAFDILRI
jgi:predicted nucleic acid-binding protein